MVICFACGSIYTSDNKFCLCREKIVDQDNTLLGLDPMCNECDERHDKDKSCISEPQSTDPDQTWYDMHEQY